MVFTGATFLVHLFYLIFGLIAVIVGILYLFFNNNKIYDVIIYVMIILIGLFTWFYPNTYLLIGLGVASLIMTIIKIFQTKNKKYEFAFLKPLIVIEVMASLSGSNIINITIKILGLLVIALGIYFLILFIKNKPFQFLNIKEKFIKVKSSKRREKKDGSIDAKYKEKDI